MSIYALLDESGAVRYIGQTRQALAARLAEHLTQASGRARNAWLCEMRSRGQMPSIVLLEVVAEAEADEAEERQRAAHLARGCTLTNGGRRRYGHRQARRDLKAVTILLPPQAAEHLQAITLRTATPVSVLLRQWIIERIEQLEREKDQ